MLSNVKMKIKNYETGEISEPVDIEDVILNQRDIEFIFSDGGTLPYKDFLFFSKYYEIILYEGD